jgi:hypothetical protein
MSAWNRLRARRREGDLDGVLTPAPRIGRLLEPARAPGTARELAREDEAVRQFHRAHLDSAQPTREAALSPRSRRTGLQAAIGAAGVVALMSTGAAFAASDHAPWSRTSSGRPAALPTHAGTQPSEDPSESESDEPSDPGDTSAARSTAGPNAHAYPGLCRAYAAGKKSEHGEALSSTAFTVLATAAGGADAVAEFCAALVPAQDHGSSAAGPTHPAAPTHPVTPTGPAAVTPTHPVPTRPATPSHPSHATTHPGPDSHPSKP